jgi:hypothetical protein
VGTATFTSPTDAAAPTAVVYNGQRVIRTNGTSQRLGVSISLTQPTTVVLVARHVSLPAGSQYLISRGTGVGFNIGSSGNNALWQMIAGATLNAPSMSVPDTKPHVFIASLNGASSAFNIDGAEVTGNAGTVNETTMWLGGSQTAWFNTDYYRLAVIPGTMTAPQREAIRAQMAARYGI